MENSPRVAGVPGEGEIISYLRKSSKGVTKKSKMSTSFADVLTEVFERSHALEAITILRSVTAYNDASGKELLDNARSRTLILFALNQSDLDLDKNEEFPVTFLEMFNNLSGAGLALPPVNILLTANPWSRTPVAAAILKQTLNELIIVASFQLLALLIPTQ